MQAACRLLSEFVAGKTYPDYEQDALLRSAVERQFTIIGEALGRLLKLEPGIATNISNTRQILAFRNILIHGYNIIQHDVVWGVLENDLSALIREIDKLMAQDRDDLPPADVSTSA
jgi:uncharacterized protein with HEPN domain